MKKNTWAVPSDPVLWIKLAALYLLCGIGIGMYMGAAENFQLKALHAHVNLLGWASGALMGFFYCHRESVFRSLTGRAHFWLHNVGTPVMMAGLAGLLTGIEALLPLLLVGQVMVGLGCIAFAVNVFKS